MTNSTTGNASLLREALMQVRSLKQRLQQCDYVEPIAIVGAGCRFPAGADDPSELWDLCLRGVDAVTEVPHDRWSAASFFDPDPHTPGKAYTRWGAFLGSVDRFDPEFFGISPREAELIDPQQRLLLEVTWEALENAAIASTELKGASVGVFVGMCADDYAQLTMTLDGAQAFDAQTGLGISRSAAAGRIAYLLGLRGPAIQVDTSCSSSLAAVHLACQSLRCGECDVALAGGVHLLLSPLSTVVRCKTTALSPDGRCRAFGASANGFVQGEGAGVVVLKRLRDVHNARDRVLAVVRGSAVNHNGRSNGISAPSQTAQEDLIHRALKLAGVQPNEVGYVEAHGTGTSLGDPIEVSALATVFSGNRRQPLYIGSAKSNFGHLEAAAGVLSLIKVTMSLGQGVIAPTLHVGQKNPHVEWEKLPLAVVDRTMPWPEGGRIAGVSSFGMSGTNVHLIVAQAPDLEQGSQTPPPEYVLLPLSAKQPESLCELAGAYATHVRANPQISLHDLCYTASIGRTQHAVRVYVLAKDQHQLAEGLARVADDTNAKPPTIGQGPPRIGFLFSGQGSQYPAMGATLYLREPVFKEALEACNRIVQPLLGHSLVDLVTEASNSNLLDDTRYTQPALFAFEYALSRLWASWGIHPTAVVGHSLGEYVAAHIAGVFGLEEALQLVVARAKLMSELPGSGGMIAVHASESEVRKLIDATERGLSIAAINGPTLVVVSGPNDSLERLCGLIHGHKWQYRRLRVSGAFHSAMVEPMLDEFGRLASKLTYSVPDLPLYSNTTGHLATSDVACAEYWVEHTRSTVRFWDSIVQLSTSGVELGLELGPKDTLTAMVRSGLGDHQQATWISSIASGGDSAQLSRCLGELFIRGAPVDWGAVYRERPGRKLVLPKYPFRRRRFWSKAAEMTMNEYTQRNNQAPMHSPPKLQLPGEHEGESATLGEVRRLFATMLNADPLRIDATATLLELGADSLLIVSAIKEITTRFGVVLTIEQLFERVNSLSAIALYVEQHAESLQDRVAPNAPSAATRSRPIEVTNLSAAHEPISRLWAGPRRLNQAPFAKTCGSIDASEDRASSSTVKLPGTQAAATTSIPKAAADRIGAPSVRRVLGPPEARDLNAVQLAHLADVVGRFTARTRLSRQRRIDATSLCNNRRSSGGFRFETKEMLYPIVACSSSGSHVTDLDGNDYVDLAMGFGAALFGHGASFIRTAVESQISKGFQIGPEAELSADVAARICAATNMDRALFNCSGTEAVMTALRVARAAVGRPKIATFSNAYHGHFDGTLVVSSGERESSLPMSPGTPRSMTSDTLVLRFNDKSALDAIARHANELAAVIIEPVQNRRPDVHPRSFLHELREITRRHEIALIFDEILVGFRIHRGGAAAWFDVDPDIATYGKVIGGGLPLAVVAGKSRFMDYVDGGTWAFGDRTYPTVESAYTAGTFSKHPLALAAARAVLVEMERLGPSLHLELNLKTDQMGKRVNALFKRYEVPITLVNFGSFFRFSYQGNLSFVHQPLELELFFAHLALRGVYLWEGRTCFLATAHSTADIQYVEQAIEDALIEMCRGGFLTERAA